MSVVAVFRPVADLLIRIGRQAFPLGVFMGEIMSVTFYVALVIVIAAAALFT